MAATDAKPSVAAIGSLNLTGLGRCTYTATPAKSYPFSHIKIKTLIVLAEKTKAMAITVTKKDNRYATLKKGHNVRWPASEADAVSRIELCETPQDAAEALQRIVSAGLRPT